MEKWLSRFAKSVITKVGIYDSHLCFRGYRKESIFDISKLLCVATKSEERRINAFGWKCLRHICGVRWFYFIPNVEIQRRTGALPLSTIIQRSRLSLLWSYYADACEFGTSDVRSLLVAKVPDEWKRPRGRPRSSWLRTV